MLSPQKIARAVADLERRCGEMTNEMKDLRWWLQQTSDRGDESAGRLGAVIDDQQRMASELAQLGRLKRLVAADVPLRPLAGLDFETFDAGLGGSVVGFRDGGRDEGEGMYAGFEDYFRGSEAEIRERQQAYLPLMKGRARVLDVGCGRGEFLAIMREAGIDAKGIDLDPAMVQRCLDKGFDVELADAVSYLESSPQASLGAVFAAQVIEHLTYDDLVRLLRAARDRLQPGGILVMETVNPHSPQARKHFWIDPTHRNPIFPETMLALCRLTGYAEAYIWHPQGAGDPDRDRLEQFDYAVIATSSSVATTVPASN